MFFFVYAGFGGLYTIAPESFPTDIRATGMAYINICARAGGIIAPIITGALLEFENGFQIAISIFAALYFSVAGYIFFLPETKISKRGLLSVNNEL